MHRLLSNLTRLRSAVPLAHRPVSRSRWFAAVATGAVIALTACVLLVSGGLIAGRPVQAFSKQSREAGAVTFHAKGCEHCHGVDGTGTDRGPNLAGIGKRWKKDHIEQQIREGGGGMPPFGDALQPDEVKALVDYLGAKRKTPKPVPSPVPAPVSPKLSSDDSGV